MAKWKKRATSGTDYKARRALSKAERKRTQAIATRLERANKSVKGEDPTAEVQP